MAKQTFREWLESLPADERPAIIQEAKEYIAELQGNRKCKHPPAYRYLLSKSERNVYTVYIHKCMLCGAKHQTRSKTNA